MKISTYGLTRLVLLTFPLLCRAQAPPGLTIVAGGGVDPFAIGDGGPAVGAPLKGPDAVTVDNAGNLYIWTTSGYTIRKVNPAGIISTVVGTGKPGFSGDGGPATSAQIQIPVPRASLATDSAGNLYIADGGNRRVRKVDTAGIITTVAGNGQISAIPTGDGNKATDVPLCDPIAVAVDPDGNLYIGDGACLNVRKVDTSGIISTVAGSGKGGFSGDGGPATKADMLQPFVVATDSVGNFYIIDEAIGSRVRKVDKNGTITTIAGNGTKGFSGDGGPAVNAQLFEARGLAVDHAGNIYIADYGNGRVRKVDTSGNISTVAGNGNIGIFDIALDKSGEIYIANFIKGFVYKVTGPPGAAPPSIAAHGVVNGANFIPGIASGAWISILGSGLSATTRSWSLSDFDGDNLPTVLDGVSVKVNGTPAYIYYISPTQLNVLAPDGLPTGNVLVQVTTAAGKSAGFRVAVTPVSPAFFLFTAKYPAAVHPSGVPVGKVGLIAGANFTPAKPGETILLFGTGFGATNPPLPAGKLVKTAAPLANTVQVTIGGQTAHVDFAGVSGSGLVQLNVQIPPGLPDGDAAVLATIAGSTTQESLFITVQH